MKTTALIFTLATLTACGAPFEASVFTEGGNAGQIGLGEAGATPEAGAPSAGTAGRAELAGAGGTPSAAGTGGSGGRAGTAGTGGTAPTAGSGGSAGTTGGTAGTASGGTAGTVATAGSGGQGMAGGPPQNPPCDPATIVAGKVQMDLGTVAWCLKTTQDLDYFTCSNWDSRTIQVNGQTTPCWVKFGNPVKINGWNYIQITAGTSNMATLNWSTL
jgi:hypothetical protein